MPLEGDLSYFRSRQDEFVAKHHGQFVLIHNQTVDGFYDDETEAYLIAKKKFYGETFFA